MENVLSSLNITDVSLIPQEQINNIMNVKLIVPELIFLTISIYIIFIITNLIYIKGENSKIKVLGLILWTLPFVLIILAILCFFPNTIYQILNSLMTFLNQ